MLTDTHMHTKIFSSDAVQTPEQIIKTAAGLKMARVAVTDHYDMDYPHKDEIMEFDLEEYGKTFPLWRDLSAELNGPELLMGIEIGWQPHLGDRIRKAAAALPFDSVILSNHLFRGTDIYYSTETGLLSRKERNREYIGTLAKMCRQIDDFDIAAHYDYINRYIEDKDSAVFYSDCPEQFDDFFDVLISRNKALEINTSSIEAQIRKGADYIMPDPDIIRRYIAMGGKLFTIGSDAHDCSSIGQHFERTARYLRSLGVPELFYYKNRMPVSDTEYSAFF